MPCLVADLDCYVACCDSIDWANVCMLKSGTNYFWELAVFLTTHLLQSYYYMFPFQFDSLSKKLNKWFPTFCKWDLDGDYVIIKKNLRIRIESQSRSLALLWPPTHLNGISGGACGSECPHKVGHRTTLKMSHLSCHNIPLAAQTRDSGDRQSVCW